MLVLLFVSLWFILRGDLFYFLPCVILFLCFSVLLALRLPRLGKRELILVLFVRFSICACLDLSVSSASWFLRRTAVCDCGIPWTFLLPFSFMDNDWMLCVYRNRGKWSITLGVMSLCKFSITYVCGPTSMKLIAHLVSKVRKM